MKIFFRSILLLVSWLPCQGFAFSDKAISVGLGYFSENFLNKTSQSETGATKFSGETNFPLNVKYDMAITMDWFVAPQLSYTIIPRKTPGDTAKVTHLHLVALFGQNFASMGMDSTFDWYFGPGIIQHEIKGAGGTVEMNNGTSTATFAVPGRTVNVRKITTNLGTSWTYAGQHRVAFDLILENLLSSKKRTQSFMISYAYSFGGGGFGGGF